MDFYTLKELIVSDKMFQTLDRGTVAHINIRQSGDWLRPLQLGKECDLYFTSSGKPVIETRKDHKYSKLKPFKTAPKVFLNEEKNKNCDSCLRNENRPLYGCPQLRDFRFKSVLT
ncbi:integrase catalytic domain-containing protein [Trichonephila clavipes]|nr:integrase catalytic domain-containing protein [Trichonephila clavipes]